MMGLLPDNAPETLRASRGVARLLGGWPKTHRASF